MKYVLQRTDQGGGYVTKPGSEKSYSPRLQDARLFDSREAAKADSCENERVLSLEQAVG